MERILLLKDFLKDLKVFCENRERTVLRISGHGASGKSTLAQELLELFPEGQAQLIETDAYIMSKQYSQDVSLVYELEGKVVQHPITAAHPARHELNSLRRDLKMLEQGMDVLTPEELPWMPARYLRADCPLTIVEGITPAFLEGVFFDLSLYLETDGETELQRRLERDTAVRGRDQLFVQETHKHRRRQYELFLKPLLVNYDWAIRFKDRLISIDGKWPENGCR